MSVSKDLKRVFKRLNELNERELELWDYPTFVTNEYFVHMMEEAGEVAQCLRGKNDEPLENECVDTAICALAIAMLCTDGNTEHVVSVFNKKLDKWEKRLEKS
jgi:NTP pyrophosphatase (non-canonical NTP hydrolase)